MGEEKNQNAGTGRSFGLPALVVACIVALAIGLGIGFAANKGTSPTSDVPTDAGAQTSDPATTDESGPATSTASSSWMEEIKKYAGEQGIDGKALYKPSNTLVDEWMRICINRSDFENIQLVDGPIYVVGHKNPDADTVCSAIAFANLLTQLGFDAQPAIVNGINRETAFILEHAGVEVPQVLDNAAGKNIFLVDHSEYGQAVDGLKDAHIIGIIDHHNTGSVETPDAIIYKASPSGSTADLVWMSYMNYGIELNGQMAELLLGATLSDTKNLMMDNATIADYLAVASLADIAGIEDIKEYYDEMSRARLSLSGMSDREVFENDLREYEYAGKTYCIGVIEVFDEEEVAPLVERMKAEMEAEKGELGLDYMYAQISALHDDVTFTYLVPVDDASRELADDTFGQVESCTWDGASFVFKPGCGRKTYLVPKLNETLDKIRDGALADAA